jgi:hypothetical protein
LYCPVICGSRISVADRDRKKFEELLAGRRAGALNENWRWESLGRNNGKFGVALPSYPVHRAMLFRVINVFW